MDIMLIGRIMAVLLVFGSAWKIQDWRYDAKDKERIAVQLEIERVAHIGTIHREEIVIKAQNASTARAKKASDDAAASRNELDGVLTSTNAALSRARVSHEACLERANTFSDVFQSCTREYQGLGVKADNHANDAQTLTEGWPTKAPD